MKWPKITIVSAVAIAILSLIVYGFLPKPVECEYAKAAKGDIRVTIDVQGRTRVKDRFTLSMPVAGVISRIRCKAGDAVQAGDPLTVLTPAKPPLLDSRGRSQAEAAVKSAEATVNQAKSNVTAAESEHALARKEHLRMIELQKGKHVSQEQVDVAAGREATTAAALESAKFGEQAAAFQLEMSRAALIEENDRPAEMAIHAPVSGRVLRVYRESEGPVAPGEPLLEIGDPASLEVVADVLSADAVRVKTGMNVSIERWGGEALSGTVRLVEPGGFTKISSLGVEEQRVNVVVDFVGAGALGDGYRVEARIIVSESKDVLKVPVGALFSTDEGEALFVVVEDAAALRKVKLGVRNGLEAHVTAGLNPGDVVIIHPSDEVSDGRAVTERE